MKRLALALALLVPLSLIAAASPALAESAPDKGRSWEPSPRSKALYGTKAPDEDPEVQRHYVEGGDGTQLYVETWL
ncbi:MAG: hypothetical protein ACRDLB_16075, partial [Actinomycetota bacterium]